MCMRNTKARSHFNMQHNNVPIETPYEFSVLQDQHIDETVDVFTKSFCRSEPMTKYLDMDEEKYKVFARAVVEKARDDQISIVALDQGKVIACALSEDLVKPGAIPDFDPKFIYILSLLESLGENFFKDKVISPNQIAHLFITAVHEDYRGLGLSKQVNFRAMDLAAQKGFDFIYCELTNVYNELGIMRHLKNPKQLIGTATYNKFEYEQERPFADLGGMANAYLWAISPDAKLVYQQNGMTITEDFSSEPE